MLRGLGLISFGQIGYGAVLTALGVVLVLVVALRERRSAIVGSAIFATAASVIGWNAILRATHAENFFTDAPVAVFPASWQDFGSGVFALAEVTLVLGLGPMRRSVAVDVVKVGVACALVAFLVDIYLY